MSRDERKKAVPCSDQISPFRSVVHAFLLGIPKIPQSCPFVRGAVHVLKLVRCSADLLRLYGLEVRENCEAILTAVGGFSPDHVLESLMIASPHDLLAFRGRPDERLLFHRLDNGGRL